MPPPGGKLTEARLLDYLLGAKPELRRPWWGGVELVVPAGGLPPFVRASAPLLANGPPLLADPEFAREIRRALATPSGATTRVRTFLLGEGVELKNPEATDGALPIPGRDIPRLKGALVSSAELFDLRLAYRALFGERKPQGKPPWRRPLQAAMTTLEKLASHPDVQLFGFLDQRLQRDSLEARAVRLREMLNAPEPAQTRATPLTSSLFGFGTISNPVPSKRREGGQATAGAFVDCCEQLGITAPSDIAATAGLEHANAQPGAQQPSILEDREGAIRYWTKRKSDRRRR